MIRKTILNKLEKECKECDLYNLFGCVHICGRIICKTRDYLIQYKIENNMELPYNWKRRT